MIKKWKISSGFGQNLVLNCENYSRDCALIFPEGLYQILRFFVIFRLWNQNLELENSVIDDSIHQERAREFMSQCRSTYSWIEQYIGLDLLLTSLCACFVFLVICALLSNKYTLFVLVHYSIKKLELVVHRLLSFSPFPKADWFVLFEALV